MKIRIPTKKAAAKVSLKPRFLRDQAKPFDKFKVEQVVTMGDFAKETRDRLPGESEEDYNDYLRPFLRAIIARQNQVNREAKPALDNGCWLNGKPHYFQSKAEMEKAWAEKQRRLELEKEPPTPLKAKFLRPVPPLKQIREKVRSVLNDSKPKEETALPVVHPSKITPPPGNERKPVKQEELKMGKIDNQARIARQKKIFKPAPEVISVEPKPDSILARLARLRAQQK